MSHNIQGWYKTRVRNAAAHKLDTMQFRTPSWPNKAELWVMKDDIEWINIITENKGEN